MALDFAIDELGLYLVTHADDQEVLNLYWKYIALAKEGGVSFIYGSQSIADEAAIGMVNNKTTAVRLLPTPGKNVGDTVEMGGLLGSAPVMPVHKESSADFIQRGGRIPAPLHSLRN